MLSLDIFCKHKYHTKIPVQINKKIKKDMLNTSFVRSECYKNVKRTSLRRLIYYHSLIRGNVDIRVRGGGGKVIDSVPPHHTRQNLFYKVHSTF